MNDLRTIYMENSTCLRTEIQQVLANLKDLEDFQGFLVPSTLSRKTEITKVKKKKKTLRFPLLPLPPMLIKFAHVFLVRNARKMEAETCSISLQVSQ